MNKTIQAIRGMNDILPTQVIYWQFIEKQWQTLMQRYAWQEIRFPILESTHLFKRGVGEHTDIVEKEMYTFDDRNGDSLSLRPEGTASCVRAALQHGLLHHKLQKLWYSGPMFRHERPQKGRYRQFYQFGLEAFGMNDPLIDTEIIVLIERLWRALNLNQYISLQINSLGAPTARAVYRRQLVEYFQQHLDQLDADSQRRLSTNPLRILDSKNPQVQTLIAKAPKITDYLDEPAQQQLQQVCDYLQQANINYHINPALVRGLDYYTGLVFEWVTDTLGGQGTLCAGGRYDGLVQQLSGKPTPAVGLALGLERLVLLLSEQLTITAYQPHIYFIHSGQQARQQTLILSEQLRECYPQLALQVHCGSESFKSQMKKADKSGARIALILGEDEIRQDQITVKYLREDRLQETILQTELNDKIKRLLN